MVLEAGWRDARLPLYDGSAACNRRSKRSHVAVMAPAIASCSNLFAKIWLNTEIPLTGRGANPELPHRDQPLYPQHHGVTPLDFFGILFYACIYVPPGQQNWLKLCSTSAISCLNERCSCISFFVLHSLSQSLSLKVTIFFVLTHTQH